MGSALCRRNEYRGLDHCRHEAGYRYDRAHEGEYPPRDSTTFLTGIGIPTRQYYLLEGAGLAHSHDRKIKPGLLFEDWSIPHHTYERAPSTCGCHRQRAP